MHVVQEKVMFSNVCDSVHKVEGERAPPGRESRPAPPLPPGRQVGIVREILDCCHFTIRDFLFSN